MEVAMRKYVLCTLCILLVLLVAACGKHTEEQPNVTGQAEGTVDFTGETPKIDIGNVFAYIGQEIDYTTGLEYLLGDAYFEVQVNAADVRGDKPGTYDVDYTFQYGNETYSDTIQVTILEDKQGNSQGELEQDIKEEVDEQDSEKTEESTKSTDTPNEKESETKGELVTKPEDNIWEEEDLRNARIELLSGKVVTIVCTTERYIVSTKTETNMIKRQNRKYEVSKLVVEFSNGTKQVLETIEKKID